MKLVREALQAWRAAVRDVESTDPWTAPWLRARLVEDERRRKYQARVNEAIHPDTADARLPTEPALTVEERS